MRNVRSALTNSKAQHFAERVSNYGVLLYLGTETHLKKPEPQSLAKFLRLLFQKPSVSTLSGSSDLSLVDEVSIARES